MTLALILGVCSLLAWPAGNRPVVRAWFVFQTTQQGPPQSDPQQNPSTEQPAAPETEPAPAQNGPPDLTVPTETKAPEAAAPTPKKKTIGTSKAQPKRRHHKKQPATQPAGGPKKVIVRNGSAPEPTVQLAPGVTAETASRQRQSTDVLLSTTESNLKATAGRQLNSTQRDTITQVHEYMKQAKVSVDSGDLQRAHNLALKAKLLSDELAKH